MAGLIIEDAAQDLDLESQYNASLSSNDEPGIKQGRDNDGEDLVAVRFPGGWRVFFGTV